MASLLSEHEQRICGASVCTQCALQLQLSGTVFDLPPDCSCSCAVQDKVPAPCVEQAADAKLREAWMLLMHNSATS